MSVVLDFYGPHDPSFYRCIAQNAQGIGRYLTNSLTDPRQLTPAEVGYAHDAGLAIYFFYEMNPTYPGYFTFAQGAEDCRQAQARLADLDAPDGTVVYFTVDTNIHPDLVTEYCNGVESVDTPAIVPGLYGYQAMCEYAHANYPNMGKHLVQTYGIPTVPLDIWQHLQENRCGVQVDVDEAYVSGWTKETDMTPDEVKAIIHAEMDTTIQAIKERLAIDAHHKHDTTEPK